MAAALDWCRILPCPTPTAGNPTAGNPTAGRPTRVQPRAALGFPPSSTPTRAIPRLLLLAIAAITIEPLLGAGRGESGPSCAVLPPLTCPPSRLQAAFPQGKAAGASLPGIPPPLPQRHPPPVPPAARWASGWEKACSLPLRPSSHRCRRFFHPRKSGPARRRPPRFKGAAAGQGCKRGGSSSGCGSGAAAAGCQELLGGLCTLARAALALLASPGGRTLPQGARAGRDGAARLAQAAAAAAAPGRAAAARTRPPRPPRPPASPLSPSCSLSWESAWASPAWPRRPPPAAGAAPPAGLQTGVVTSSACSLPSCQQRRSHGCRLLHVRCMHVHCMHCTHAAPPISSCSAHLQSRKSRAGPSWHSSGRAWWLRPLHRRRRRRRPRHCLNQSPCLCLHVTSEG